MWNWDLCGGCSRDLLGKKIQVCSMKFSDYCFLYICLSASQPEDFTSCVPAPGRPGEKTWASVSCFSRVGAHPGALAFQIVWDGPWGDRDPLLGCGVMIVSSVTAMVPFFFFFLLVVLTWMPFHFTSWEKFCWKSILHENYSEPQFHKQVNWYWGRLFEVSLWLRGRAGWSWTSASLPPPHPAPGLLFFSAIPHIASFS